MRICIIYDCLYPHTVGGAERWYRALAERLAADGHEVDYVTLRQWGPQERPRLAGVNVVAVGPRMALYVHGRRRVAPPLRFGLGVLAYLVRHRRRYDVVHTASFPFFSMLAAAASRPLGGYALVVDWFEVWTLAYWRSYLRGGAGTVGWAVQRLCARVPQRAFCFSDLHAGRLRAEGHRGPVTVLRGLYAGPPPRLRARAEPPVVVYAGRHVPDKRVTAAVPALARAHERLPALRGLILGDGPDRAAVASAVERFGLSGTVELPGVVSPEGVERALEGALCLLLPSRREGYGLVIVEAAAHGTPSVVVDGPDNAAVELVDDGVNGVIAASASADDLAAAILRVHAAGPALRASTAAWMEHHAWELALESSLEALSAAYRDGVARAA